MGWTFSVDQEINKAVTWRNRGLLNLCDYQVCGNRTGTAGKGCDGQCSGGSFRVPDGQSGIDDSSFHDCHSNDLRNTSCAACNRIRKIRAVQCQDQLSRFCNTYLEENLVGSDFRQDKGTRAGPGNGTSAVWTVLGETDICPGGNCCRIVRRH